METFSIDDENSQLMACLGRNTPRMPSLSCRYECIMRQHGLSCL